MPSTPAPVRVDPALREELDHPHQVSLAVLQDPEASPLPAVTWCSTHVAAVARVLHPLAARVLPGGPSAVHAATEADHALQQALWTLDRRVTGDVRVAHQDLLALREDLLAALWEHVRQEQRLVDELAGRLPAAQQQALALRLASALRRAPTRPHPSAPVHGPLAAVAFGVDAGVDHVRDALDSRSWPTPHDQRPPRVPGRWGSYLMAAPYDPKEHRQR